MYVHRIQKGRHEPVFIQDNYYYFCEVEEGQEDTEFSDSEMKEDFVPMFIPLEEAIRINGEFSSDDPLYDSMIEREYMVMKLIKEAENEKMV